MLRLLNILVAASSIAIAASATADDRLLADFEGDNYGAWTATGEAFGTHPAAGTLASQREVSGYQGRGLVNSYRGGDASTGALTSPPFIIDRDYIALLVGGGYHPDRAEVQLVVGGKVVRRATGDDSEQLLWRNWDVSELEGAEAQIRIVDDATGQWGHISVDHILLTDAKRSRIDRQALVQYRNSADYYRESHRPQFHFTPELNWTNDPNGLVYYKGEWHLFYQHNPFGTRWGHMSWGHAVSEDLVHWKHLPVALHEEDGTMIFSGCCVIDWNNTSGFASGDEPAMVAVYTGHRRDNESQHLAYSNDRGRTWTKYTGNPVLDIDHRDFRDPKVFWHEPTEKWVMVVSLAAAKRIQFYGSHNLKQWELLSEFGPAGVADKPTWECPDMFPLPIEGKPGKSRWVLEVDLGGGGVAGGSGSEYFVGDFDGTRFQSDYPLDEVRWVDYGRDFYASMSFSDVPQSDGRRIWMGWMSNLQTTLLPTSPWRGAQSIPRVLSLRETSDGLRLVQQPVRELQTLRGEGLSFVGVPLADGQHWSDESFSGAQLEIIIELDVGDAAEVGLRVRKGADEFTEIGYDVDAGELYVDRTESGGTDFHPAFAGIHRGPLPAEDGRVRLHLFVDASSVEVFAGGGITVMTERIFPSASSTDVEVFARGGTATIKALNAWRLDSIWND